MSSRPTAPQVGPRFRPGAPAALAGPRLWAGAGLNSRLAWRNLAHDRTRFLVTLIGIVFSVVLMAIQLGLLYGFVSTIRFIVEDTEADLWIAGRGALTVDLASVIPERRRYQALGVPGVAWAQKTILFFSNWKRPDGGIESVILVGFDHRDGRGGPARLTAEQRAALSLPDAVIVDRLYAGKLGVTRIGQTFEVNNRRARVVGFSEGIRTFTQAPYVFASFKTAQHLSTLPEDQASYVLIGVAPGRDPAAVRAELAARLPDVDVFSQADFAARSASYWLFTTGAGTALIIAAVLGLVVGVVVVAQTLYSATVDRLPEYATLRAMGAPRAYLYAIILKQALIAATIGYAVGIVVSGGIVWTQREGSAAMLLPVWIALGVGAITVAMCVAAALISIRRVTVIDPASVFK